MRMRATLRTPKPLHVRPRVAALALAMLAAMTGCKDKGAEPSSAPPPPPSVPVAKAGVCATGGGEIADPASAAFFPRTVTVNAGDYCVDPQGDTRTYGDKAKLSMDEVCTTAVDGECE